MQSVPKPIKETKEEKIKRQLDRRMKTNAARIERQIAKQVGLRLWKGVKTRKKASSMTSARRKSLAWKKQVKRLDDLVREIVKLRDPASVISGIPRTQERLDPGHLISRNNYSTRWDLRNVNAQTRGENLSHEYHPEPYTSWFIHTYGIEVYDELRALSRQPFDRKRAGDIEFALQGRLAVERRLAKQEEFNPVAQESYANEGTQDV